LKENKEATSLLNTLINAQASVYHQAQALNAEFDLKITSKDLHNYKAKNKPIGDQAQQLYDELEKIKNNHPNSIVKVRVNENNDVQCIFIQTKFLYPN